MFRKKKILTFFIIIASLPGVLYIAARVTGALSMYSIPTYANEPTIKLGSYIISSNLITSKRFDFIVFKYDEPNVGKSTSVHRLCGLPGDEIELRNGNLYVNGNPADAGLNLNFEYRIYSHDILKVSELFELDKVDWKMSPVSEYEWQVILNNEQVKQLASLNIQCRPDTSAKDEPNEYIQQVFNQPWNADHFGPYRVPPDHYFVLGDNRHQALDSRYIGAVPKKDWVGTMVGKW